MPFALLVALREPCFGNIANTFEFLLHLRVLRVHQFGARVLRHKNRRSKQNHRSRKRHWKKKVIPGFLKRSSPIDSDVKHHNRRARFAREHYRPRFRNVTRAARPINRERAISSFLDSPRHDGEAPQSAARRTSLRRSESKPLNHFARPLPVERG